MDLTEYAKGLGVDLTEKKIISEKRYTVIIEVIHKDKKYAAANTKPVANIQEAKKIALNKLKFIPQKDDLMTYRCLEITYATVPIENILINTRWELQPIVSRWLTHEELMAALN